MPHRPQSATRLNPPELARPRAGAGYPAYREPAWVDARVALAAARAQAEKRRRDGAAAFAAANGWLHAHCFGLPELISGDKRLTRLADDLAEIALLGDDPDRFRSADRRAMALVGHVPLKGRTPDEIEAAGERWLLARGLKLTACPAGLFGAWRAAGEQDLLPVVMTRVEVDVIFPNAFEEEPSGEAPRPSALTRGGPNLARRNARSEALAAAFDWEDEFSADEIETGIDATSAPAACRRAKTRSARRAARQACRRRPRRLAG